MKKLISSILSLVIIMTLLPTSAFAVTNNYDIINQQVSNTSVKFLQISNSKVVYTYEENGNTYKNIDTITSPNTVETQVYLLTNNGYTHFDTITSVIDGQTLNTISDTNGTSSNTIARASNEHDWQYQNSYDGDTSVRNQSITAIAILLGGLIGGPYGAFLAVAAYLFDKNINTVYYTKESYRDMNSTQTRPIFKYVTYFYEDAARTKEIEGSPVVQILDLT